MWVGVGRVGWEDGWRGGVGAVDGGLEELWGMGMEGGEGGGGQGW